MSDVIDLGLDELSGFVEIGAGGFATVYMASDNGFNRQVAVKVLHGLDDDAQRRFDRERSLMGQLSEHPNVVTPYRSGYTANRSAYLVMEYAAGGSLQDLVDQQALPTTEQAVNYILPIADALGHGHEAGILHRDVKPANILLTGANVPKLTDYGIASIRQHATTQVAFTLAHTPPETFSNGSDDRDHRADLYSLGSTLYTLLAGRVPFAIDGPDSQQAYLRRIIESQAPPLNRGPGLDAFLTKALAKDPTQRHQSAADFAHHLMAATGMGTHPPAISGPHPIVVVPTNVTPSSFPSPAPARPITADTELDGPATDQHDAVGFQAAPLAAPQAAPAPQPTALAPVTPPGPSVGRDPDPETTTSRSGAAAGIIGFSSGAAAGMATGHGTDQAGNAQSAAGEAGSLLENPASSEIGGASNPGIHHHLAVAKAQSATIPVRALGAIAAAAVMVVAVVAGWAVLNDDDALVRGSAESASVSTVVELIDDETDAKEAAAAPSTSTTSATDQSTSTTEGDGPTSTTTEGDTETDVTPNPVEVTPEVRVPNVVGDSVTAATDELDDAGFSVRVVTRSSDAVAIDRVISQSPGAGGQAERGSTIELVVSDGPDTPANPTVPQVILLPVDLAIDRLNDNGFSNVATVDDYSEDVPEGDVISSNPSAGQEVSASTEIKLTVSLGPEPVIVEDAIVPNINGLSRSGAEAAVTNAGLIPVVTFFDVDFDSGLGGTVVLQDPLPGAFVPAGSTVTIGVGVQADPPDLSPGTTLPSSEELGAGDSFDT